MRAEKLVHALQERGLTIATAESLTAGLVSASICDVPGASRCFAGGVAAYQDEVKAQWLSVRPETLERFSAVSAACARQMARNVKEKFHSGVGISTTGYAGPTGSPVGLVFIGIAAGDQCKVYRLQWNGSRQGVREMTVNLALYLALKSLDW